MPPKNKVRLQSKKNILTKNPAKVKMLHNKKKKQKNSTPQDTGNNSSEKQPVKNPLKKLATSTITKIKNLFKNSSLKNPNSSTLNFEIITEIDSDIEMPSHSESEVNIIQGTTSKKKTFNENMVLLSLTTDSGQSEDENTIIKGKAPLKRKINTKHPLADEWTSSSEEETTFNPTLLQQLPEYIPLKRTTQNHSQNILQTEKVIRI